MKLIGKSGNPAHSLRSPFGPVAQLGERSVRIREVEGSNPFGSTIARRYELFIVRNVFGLTIKIEDRWKTVLYLLFAKKMPPVLPTPRASPENDQTGNFSIFRL